MTVKGMEDKDVFVYLHTPRLATNGNMFFRFFTVSRNETGTVALNNLNVEDGNSDGWKLWDYYHGIRGAGIATGDFDGDGYKNEIAICFFSDITAWVYFYRVTSVSNNQLKVEYMCSSVSDENGGWTTLASMQASPNVVTGDFDGDGKDEVAFVSKRFTMLQLAQTRVKILKCIKNSDGV